MLATDAALLNKSLLDQLDAPEDAEPLSSNDSSTESPRLKTMTAAGPVPAFYSNRASFNSVPNTNRAPTRNFFNDPFALQQHYPYPNTVPPQQPQPIMHSQTPYGPHVPASIPLAPPPPMLPPTQEDISTIFVVGFPEDMQEREFQNMFTFSPGFEAATLKIPNKEYTSYGLPPMPMGPPPQRALGGAGQYNSYAGSNDPYNLLTVNQGGVVVDAGRDGITSSWPAAAPQDDPSLGAVQSHLGMGPGPYPPRKQIIGFAKFRTREEALGARDVLQGRRIDIEKGAVLKAEMAKKNLHTKRGVGPVAGPALGVNGNNGQATTMQMMGNGNDMYDALATMSPREREAVGPTAAALAAAIGLPSNANGRWSSDDVDEMMAAMALQERQQVMRGPRERVAEEEAERLRRRERDRRAGGFETFAQQHREREQQQPQEQAGPWGVPGRRPPSPDSQSGHTHDFALFAGEAPRAFSSPPPTAMMQPPAEFVPGRYGVNGATVNGSYIPHAQDGFPSQSYPVQQQQAHPFLAHRQERSDSSASDGSDEGHNMAVRPIGMRAVNGYVNGHVNGNGYVGARVNGHGHASSSGSGTSSSSKGSPQLGSPESVGASANTANGVGPVGPPPVPHPHALAQLNTAPIIPNNLNGNNNAARAVDQNPPINTLYVGNLPSNGAAVGPGGMEYLESTLRELFGSCAGFRQMSFRPKANGPMCFVEFEDVSYATKTLNELYGHTLGGLIKGGGIRLSYSKNPFGVRTPTSAGVGAGFGVQMQMAQQQQQAGMVLRDQQLHGHQHQHSMAAAEAAFHGHVHPQLNGHVRLTSPPPIPQQQQLPMPLQQPPQAPQPVDAPPFVAGPRFYSAAGEQAGVAGPAGPWARRWETPRSLVGGNGNGSVVQASGLVSPPPTATTAFAPFTPPEIPDMERDAQLQLQ